jgi:hypothetical protein
MMKTAMISLLSTLLFGFISMAYGHASYTGYSGAPGSNGACASSCHGNSGGTIEISGFPDFYLPGQEYEITISHAGGNAIRQFNGSCRIGTGSVNAGVITGGTNTVTYNNTHETNGIHFASANQNSGTFNWTAPSSGTGDVSLYIAGLQGNMGGLNTTLVILAQELTTGIGDEIGNIPRGPHLSQNYPNPFNAGTTIDFSVAAPGAIKLVVYDLLGREIETIIDGPVSSGNHSLAFDASRLSSGVYFYRLQTGETVLTKRMILLK